MWEGIDGLPVLECCVALLVSEPYLCGQDRLSSSSGSRRKGVSALNRQTPASRRRMRSAVGRSLSARCGMSGCRPALVTAAHFCFFCHFLLFLADLSRPERFENKRNTKDDDAPLMETGQSTIDNPLSTIERPSQPASPIRRPSRHSGQLESSTTTLYVVLVELVRSLFVAR